eukprot:361954-Chlamydomonas_euryale.AAC.3
MIRIDFTAVHRQAIFWLHAAAGAAFCCRAGVHRPAAAAVGAQVWDPGVGGRDIVPAAAGVPPHRGACTAERGAVRGAGGVQRRASRRERECLKAAKD